MNRRAILIMGTGGHASVVADLARSAGFDVVGCIGPEAPTTAIGAPYLGDDSVLQTWDSRTGAAIGAGSVGKPMLRRQLFQVLQSTGRDTPILVHSTAIVAPSATVGCGSQIMAGAIIQPHAQIGENVIVNTGAIVEHHARIGDHVHIAPGAVVCGNVTISPGSHIGANATVLQGLNIGSGAVIGAGAVVTRHIEDEVVVKGTPAR